uniref:Laminin subunit gamma-1 n=1 Tax=Strigamia maritima TaxID=126957 RepID=T1IVA6_STRMM
MAPTVKRVLGLHVLLTTILLVVGQHSSDDDESECYDRFGKAKRCIPEFVNAAFNVRVEATSTCGIGLPTEFCVQTGVTAAQKYCDICDARFSRTAHGSEYLTDFNNEDNLTWWQSETLLEARNRLPDSHFAGLFIPLKVNLTLSLGKKFDITYVRLKFYSPRPESFAIYKRTDEDYDWIPYQYYSGTCRDTYSRPDLSHVWTDDETQPLCTSDYSDISPLTGGNVAFSTLEGRPSANNFENSKVLQEWVTATDIRITLDRLNMFGDEVFGDPKVLKSYFYAVSDLAVGGRCKCNGHARHCISPHGNRLYCQCEHNTAGDDCEKCQPFYNDKRWQPANGTHANICEPCNCSGRSNRCTFNATLFELTHGRTGGYCEDCSGDFSGPNCEVCRTNYYLRSDGICVPCECNEIGSHSLQCNSFGQCQCKSGVTGEKCDRCEANFYDFNFQGCRSCSCDLSGSLGNTPNCDTAYGICACKENVEGQRCESCKPGYFNLDVENDFGCTPCFCYGHSSICHSAHGYSKVAVETLFNRDAEQWTARDQHDTSVLMQYNANVQNIAVSAPIHGTAYFVAPKQFLGDQRGAYNQFFSFDFRINRDDPRASVEDIVLEGVGLQIRQPIFGQGNPLPSTQIQNFKFRLHEHANYGWNPTLSARDFMSVLSNLTAIRIRATYSQDGVGFLDNAKLETTQRVGYGSEAKWIERCICNEGYLGQFCESCAPGYHHDPPGDDPFARCVPCSCHGHADICDDATGRCVCRHNTAGDHCERCARGYYGNALTGNDDDCQPCPCPNRGSCVALGNYEIACLECPEGYGGHQCDVCTDGYFGDPTGRYGFQSACQKCDCNANVDPNAVGYCNKTTGECVKCIYNTAGSRCEKCLPGYFGDALTIPKGDCKPCKCNYLGSQTHGYGPVYCDSLTGQCECKSNVRGFECDQCFDGYWNLNSGNGCEHCNCDPVGSTNHSCDVSTGQCICQPGVTGRHCDQCASYNFAFSSKGCTACECDAVGSLSLQCEDKSGQCQCREFVEGRRCDRCKENRYDKHAGCIKCPDCYNLVNDAVENHRSKLFELRELLENIEKNPELIEDLDFDQKMKDVMIRIDILLRDAENAGGDDKNLLKKIEDLHERLKPLKETLREITEKVDYADARSKEGVANITTAEEIIQKIREDLLNAQKNVREDGAVALEKAKERSEKFGQQSDRMSQIASEARTEADRQETEAINIDVVAKEALNTSQEAFKIASDALAQQRSTGEDIYKLRQDLLETEKLMRQTKEMAKEALEKATSSYDDALSVYTDAQGLILPDNDVDEMKRTANEITEEAKAIQDEADKLLEKNRDKINQLKREMDEAEELLAKGEEQQQITDGLLAQVHNALEVAKEAVKDGDETLKKANETLQLLLKFDTTVQASKLQAKEALSKIPEIQELIRQAEKKTQKAKGSLTGAQTDAAGALEIALEALRIAEQASKDATKIRKEAEETKQKANLLRDLAEELAKKVAETTEQLQALHEQADSDKTLAAKALEGANEAKQNAEHASRKVKDSLTAVNEILNILAKADDIDTNQLNELERKLKAAEMELETSGIEQRMKELEEAKLLQAKWVRDYEEEVKKLRIEVKNIQTISESLPDKCYKRVQLEPPESTNK